MAKSWKEKEIFKTFQKELVQGMVKIIETQSPEFYYRLVNSIEKAKGIMQSKNLPIPRHSKQGLR